MQENYTCRLGAASLVNSNNLTVAGMYLTSYIIMKHHLVFIIILLPLYSSTHHCHDNH